MTCFSISAFMGHGFFLTGSANQKTKNGGGESGLRVNFNYLSIANTYNQLRCAGQVRGAPRFLKAIYKHEARRLALQRALSLSLHISLALSISLSLPVLP